MAADIRQEDEQAFILTLVEIPTSAAAEFTDTTAQSVPASLLPAPILVKSASSEERADGSVNLPVASLHQGAMCLPVSGRDGSEKSPANLDLTTRKRFHCSLEESDQAPPAKKSSLTSRILHQEYASGVCSTELINVLDETGESCKGRAGSPSPGSSVHPDPAKEHLESACQSLASGTVNEITSPHGEKSVPQCARVEVTQEERTDAACASPWMEDKMPATKPPLSRPHRKPLGFLSLICSKKTSLGSDEPAQVHRKKRLKPLIPAARQSVKRSDPPSEIQETRQEPCDALPALSISAGAQHRETRQEPCDALPAPSVSAGAQYQETRQEPCDALPALSVSAGAQHQETRQEPCDALPAPSLDARAQHRETRQEPCDALPAPSIYTGAQHQETRRELCDAFPALSVYTGAQHQETRQEPHDALPALSVYTGAQHQETRQESCDTLLAPNANVGSQPQETRQELRDALPSPSVDARGQPQETRQESWDALPAPSVDAESQPQETRWESRDTLPAPNADAGSQPENPGESAAQVQVSCDEAPRRGECQSGQHAAPAEEPTTVSEYFFNDIFIEVDEAE
ncbi:transcription factor TFIIIB component B'' homolog [Ochotona curzoniae]|uniref:transcription factor TFIIIB component B'' homolog n=1 Tax=Ochotona curzoniae TaxID=130825 RepID=UPI001B34CBF0|nr:transcription factor TFIIIB component B'' homolog [Ochotona curzoniae]